MNDDDRAFIDALTVEQVEAAIKDALRDHEIEVVPGLLKVLAVKDPHRAQLYLNALDLAIAMRENPDASVLDLALGVRSSGGES